MSVRLSAISFFCSFQLFVFQDFVEAPSCISFKLRLRYEPGPKILDVCFRFPSNYPGSFSLYSDTFNNLVIVKPISEFFNLFSNVRSGLKLLNLLGNRDHNSLIFLKIGTVYENVKHYKINPNLNSILLIGVAELWHLIWTCFCTCLICYAFL